MVTVALLIHNSQKEMQLGHLKCGINTLNPKEAEKSVICNKMDKPRAYYPKWNMADAETQRSKS